MLLIRLATTGKSSSNRMRQPNQGKYSMLWREMQRKYKQEQIEGKNLQIQNHEPTSNKKKNKKTTTEHKTDVFQRVLKASCGLSATTTTTDTIPYRDNNRWQN